MCLNSIAHNFSMKWCNAEKDFIGYGFKNYLTTEFHNKKLMIRKNLSWESLVLNSWSEATGCYGKWDIKDSTEYSTDYVPYWPGFHIFLKKKDSDLYRKNGRTFRVMFKGLICVGLNDTSSEFGPCIVARHMKILEMMTLEGTSKLEENDNIHSRGK